MKWFEDHPLGTIAIILAMVIALALIQASQEARTFNKLTRRTDVTTWDALWVSLRVDCTPVP